MRRRSFIFGGNTELSYEELLEKRAIADELAAAASGAPQNISEGLSNLGAALGSRIASKRANAGLTKGRSAFDAQFNDYLGLSGNAAPTQPPSPAPATSRAPSRPVASDGRTQRPAPGQPQFAPPVQTQPQTAAVDPRNPQPLQAPAPQAASTSAIAQQLSEAQTVPPRAPRQLQQSARTPEPVQVASLGGVPANDTPQRQIQQEQLIPATSDGDLPRVLSYNNGAAVRDDPLVASLEQDITQAVSQVYGKGYTVQVYSGGQAQKGSGLARVGSTRHDGGNAGDVRIFDPQGKQVKGDDLAPLGQFWAASGNGGVGMEMRGGGIHLDNHDDRARVWNYANQGGQYTPAQQQAVAAGLKGQFPELANPPGIGIPTPRDQAGFAAPQNPQGIQVAQAPQQGQRQPFGGVDPRLMQLFNNPHASPEQKQMIGQLMKQQAAQNAPPTRAEQLAQERFEFEQRKFGQTQANAASTTDIARQRLELERAAAERDGKKPLIVDGVAYDPDTFQPVIKARERPTGVATDYDKHVAGAQSRGEQPLTFLEYQTQLKAAGRASTNVTVNGGDGADANLRKELDKGTGTAWVDYQKQGANAGALTQDLEVLDELVTLAPQGAISGRLANAIPGVSSAGDAFNSIVKRVAPTMRAPGSGSTSDIEYNGMLQSLPALRNKPEANSAILQIMRAKSAVNIERSAIVDQYSNREISASEARTRISEINKRSIITPELRSALEGLGADFSKKTEPSAPDADGWTVHNGVKIRKKQ